MQAPIFTDPLKYVPSLQSPVVPAGAPAGACAKQSWGIKSAANSAISLTTFFIVLSPFGASESQRADGLHRFTPLTNMSSDSLAALWFAFSARIVVRCGGEAAPHSAGGRKPGALITKVLNKADSACADDRHAGRAEAAPGWLARWAGQNGDWAAATEAAAFGIAGGRLARS